MTLRTMSHFWWGREKAGEGPCSGSVFSRQSSRNWDGTGWGNIVTSRRSGVADRALWSPSLLVWYLERTSDCCVFPSYLYNAFKCPRFLHSQNVADCRVPGGWLQTTNGHTSLTLLNAISLTTLKVPAGRVCGIESVNESVARNVAFWAYVYEANRSCASSKSTWKLQMLLLSVKPR